jgi:hypothetical protein
LGKKMKFTDKLWVVCGWVVQTAIKVTADTMEVVGSLACMAGGTGFAASFAMNETLTTSYYGSANTDGNINLNVQVKQFSYTLNHTVPFQYFTEKDGSATYTLTDYIQAITVQSASAICFASGTGLRILSANINKWQQNRVDKNHYSELRIARATLNEHLYVSANSICSSFSYALFSSLVTGLFISYVNPIGSKHNYTYPSSGAELVSTSF